MDFQTNFQQIPGQANIPTLSSMATQANAFPEAQAALTHNQNVAQAGTLANQQAAAMNPMLLQEAQNKLKLSNALTPLEIEDAQRTSLAKRNQMVLTQIASYGRPLLEAEEKLRTQGASDELIHAHLDPMYLNLQKAFPDHLPTGGYNPESIKGAVNYSVGLKDILDNAQKKYDTDVKAETEKKVEEMKGGTAITVEEKKAAAEKEKAQIQKEWEDTRSKLYSNAKKYVADKLAAARKEVAGAKSQLDPKKVADEAVRLFTSGAASDMDEATDMAITNMQKVNNANYGPQGNEAPKPGGINAPPGAKEGQTVYSNTGKKGIVKNGMVVVQ